MPGGIYKCMSDMCMDGIERSYTCVRCRETFGSEEEVVDHLRTENEAETDGRYDYSVNITGEFP